MKPILYEIFKEDPELNEILLKFSRAGKLNQAKDALSRALILKGEEKKDRMKPEYCTQNKGKCETCSLVNYGRDCRNVLITGNREKAKMGREGGRVS